MGDNGRLGVVLAGGRGRRFGRDKAWVERRGLTWAARAAAALGPLCDRVVISIRSGAANPAPRYESVADDPPVGRGPLAGIVAAAATAPGADLLVLACDYPAVETPLLAALVDAARDEASLVIAVGDDGRDHPLVALWRPGAVELATRRLAEGRSRVGLVVEQLETIRVRCAGAASQPDPLRNVNRPDQRLDD